MPLPLTYDTLPPHSTLRREFIDGALKITAIPEEPGPLVRRAALTRSALPTAMISFVTLLVGFAIFGSMYLANRRLMSESLSLILCAAFVVLCVALFALVWRIRFMLRFDNIQKAFQQTTIIVASNDRLLIESTGPLGEISRDLHAREMSGIEIIASDEMLDCFQIILADKSVINLLPGRDMQELQWVRRAIESRMAFPSVD